MAISLDFSCVFTSFSSKSICIILLLFLLVFEPFSLFYDADIFGTSYTGGTGCPDWRENSCFWVCCNSWRVAFSLSCRSYTFLLRHILYFRCFSIIFFCSSIILRDSLSFCSTYFYTSFSISLLLVCGPISILALISSTFDFSTRYLLVISAISPLNSSFSSLYLSRFSFKCRITSWELFWGWDALEEACFVEVGTLTVLKLNWGFIAEDLDY